MTDLIEPRDLSDQLGPLVALTDTQVHAARLRVAEHAHHADDARLLLDVLGIGGGA